MYSVFIDFKNGDSEEQLETTSAKKAETYADKLSEDFPGESIFITGPNDSYLNRDGHSPVGKKW